MSSMLESLLFTLGFISTVLITLAITLVVRAHALGVAEAVVRAWVRIHTVGIPEDERIRRSTEIASDVAEHRHMLRSDGYAPDLAAVLILERLIRGVWQDLAWWRDQIVLTEDMKSLDDIRIERLRFYGHILSIITLCISLTIIPGTYLYFVAQNDQWYTLAVAAGGLVFTVLDLSYERLVYAKINRLFYKQFFSEV